MGKETEDMRKLVFGRRKDSVKLRDVSMCGRGIVRNTIYVFVIRRKGLAGDFANSRRKSSGEEESLALWRGGKIFKYPRDIRHETHVQERVGFIKDKLVTSKSDALLEDEKGHTYRLSVGDASRHSFR